MRLFQGSASTFLDVTYANELVDGMVEAFRTQSGKAPNAPEVRSWSNSLPRLAGAVQLAELYQQEMLVGDWWVRKLERFGFVRKKLVGQSPVGVYGATTTPPARP